MRNFDGLTEQMIARSISLEEALLSMNLIMDSKDFTIPDGGEMGDDVYVSPGVDKGDVV